MPWAPPEAGGTATAEWSPPEARASSFVPPESRQTVASPAPSPAPPAPSGLLQKAGEFVQGFNAEAARMVPRAVSTAADVAATLMPENPGAKGLLRGVAEGVRQGAAPIPFTGSAGPQLKESDTPQTGMGQAGAFVAGSTPTIAASLIPGVGQAAAATVGGIQQGSDLHERALAELRAQGVPEEEAQARATLAAAGGVAIGTGVGAIAPGGGRAAARPVERLIGHTLMGVGTSVGSQAVMGATAGTPMSKEQVLKDTALMAGTGEAIHGIGRVVERFTPQEARAEAAPVEARREFTPPEAPPVTEPQAAPQEQPQPFVPPEAKTGESKEAPPIADTTPETPVATVPEPETGIQPTEPIAPPAKWQPPESFKPVETDEPIVVKDKLRKQQEARARQLAPAKPKPGPAEPASITQRRTELTKQLRDQVVMEHGRDISELSSTHPLAIQAERGEVGPGVHISEETARRLAAELPEDHPARFTLHNLSELEKNPRGAKFIKTNTNDAQDGQRVQMNPKEIITIDKENGMLEDGIRAPIPEGGIDVYGTKVLPPVEADIGGDFVPPEVKTAVKSDLFGKPFIDSSGIGEQRGMFHEPNAAPARVEKGATAADLKAQRVNENDPGQKKLFGTKNRRRPSGMVNVPAILDAASAGGKAAKQAVQDVRDFTTIEPIPKMTRVSKELADAATEHASAHIAVPHVVNDLLSKVFPDTYHDPAATAKTIDIINKDNILGGYDSFLAQEKRLRAAGDDVGADSAKAQADAIASKHDIKALDAEVANAPADVQKNIERWKNIVNPEMDRLYNEVKRVDPATPREGRGRHYDARINLLKAGDEGSWATKESNEPMPATRANAHRNPDVKRDRFDKSASFLGDYSTDAREVLANSFGPRLNEATKLRLYDALVDSGAAEEISPGDTPPKMIQGKPARWIKAVVPETDPISGKTRKTEVGLVVREDLVRELKDVLDTDQRLPTNPVFKALTNVQLFQLTDAITHGKNLLSVITHAQGAGAAWKDIARKVPILNSGEAVVRLINAAREIASDSPAIRAELADMAKKGLIRADYGHTGLQKATGAALARFDLGSRVIMNRFFDNLIERGLAKDTPINRRQFVNQVGVYNRRLMGPAMKAFRDYGLSPFIVAGRNFNRQGRRVLFGTPGFEAATKTAAMQVRATQLLGTTISLAVIPMMLNAASTGNPMGRSGTPLGAWDTGKDDENGNHRVLDLLQISGARRGLRSTGLEALIQGVMQGKDINTTIGNAITDIGQSALHPWVGPGVGFVAATLTGRRLDMRGRMEARQVKEGGAKQYAENFRAALESQNPLVYSMLKPAFTAAGMDLPSDSGYGKNIGGAVLKSPLGAIGVKSVRPGTNAAEDMADKFISSRFGDAKPSIETAQKITLKRSLGNQLRTNRSDGMSAISRAVASGALSHTEAKNILKKSGVSALQWDFQHLSLEEAVSVYEAATPEQRKTVRYMLGNKFKDSTLSDVKKQPLRQRVMATAPKQAA